MRAFSNIEPCPLIGSLCQDTMNDIMILIEATKVDQLLKGLAFDVSTAKEYKSAYCKATQGRSFVQATLKEGKEH